MTELENNKTYKYLALNETNGVNNTRKKNKNISESKI